MADAPRPLTITIIGWLLVVFSILTLVSIPQTYSDAMLVDKIRQMTDVPVKYVMWSSIINGVVSLICGVFMLRGQNWARYLYAIISVLGLLMSFYSTPTAGILLLTAILTVFFLVLLFLPKANAYFKQPNG